MVPPFARFVRAEQLDRIALLVAAHCCDPVLVPKGMARLLTAHIHESRSQCHPRCVASCIREVEWPTRKAILLRLLSYAL